MKRDKSLLNYHGVSQTEYCFQLLSNVCNKVFISNRKEQSSLQLHKKFRQIHDTFTNIGPLGGILSALTLYPQSAWLVLACDLPHVNTSMLNMLIKQRDRTKIATVFRSTHDNLPEPLCGIYEPESLSRLLKFQKNNCYCPRKILMESNIKIIKQPFSGLLDNINDLDAYHDTLTQLNKKSA